MIKYICKISLEDSECTFCASNIAKDTFCIIPAFKYRLAYNKSVAYHLKCALKSNNVEGCDDNILKAMLLEQMGASLDQSSPYRESAKASYDPVLAELQNIHATLSEINKKFKVI